MAHRVQPTRNFSGFYRIEYTTKHCHHNVIQNKFNYFSVERKKVFVLLRTGLLPMCILVWCVTFFKIGSKWLRTRRQLTDSFDPADYFVAILSLTFFALACVTSRMAVLFIPVALITVALFFKLGKKLPFYVKHILQVKAELKRK